MIERTVKLNEPREAPEGGVMFQTHTTAIAIADSYRKRTRRGFMQSNTTAQAIVDSYRKLTR